VLHICPMYMGQWCAHTVEQRLVWDGLSPGGALSSSGVDRTAGTAASCCDPFQALAVGSGGRGECRCAQPGPVGVSVSYHDGHGPGQYGASAAHSSFTAHQGWVYMMQVKVEPSSYAAASMSAAQAVDGCVGWGWMRLLGAVPGCPDCRLTGSGACSAHSPASSAVGRHNAWGAPEHTL
jgi:hypothetical protein